MFNLLPSILTDSVQWGVNYGIGLIIESVIVTFTIKLRIKHALRISIC